MQVSSPPSQVVLQKFGFLIMAPIALVMHGLFLLIPMGQEQKAKEPEKKEEILSIGSIAQLSSPATSTTPTPTPTTSVAPIVQQPQQNTVPAPIVQQQATQQPVKPSDNANELQQLQKKLQDLQNKVQQQAVQPTPPAQPAQVTPPVSIRTSGDLLAKLKSTPCQGVSTACRAVQLSQSVLLDKLKEGLGNYTRLADDNDQFTCYLFGKGKDEEYLDVNVAGNEVATVQANPTCKSMSVKELM